MGFDARIVTNVSDAENANIFWTFKGRPLPASERYVYSNFKTALTIKNYALSDDGTYTIQIQRDPSNFTTSDIIVKGAPPQQPKLPTIVCDEPSLPNRAICKANVEAIEPSQWPTSYTVELNSLDQGTAINTTESVKIVGK